MLLKRSRLNAGIERLRRRGRFMSGTELLLFFASASAALVILYPGRTLDRMLWKTHTFNEVTISYMENILRSDPSDVRSRLLLARGYMNINDMEKLSRIVAPLAAGNDIDILREGLYYEMLVLLSRISPEESPGKALAAGSLEQTAKRFSGTVGPSQENLLEDIAMRAMWVGRPKLAAEMYLSAMKTQTGKSRRMALFVKALKTMESANMPSAALDIAETVMKGFEPDLETLTYLFRLSRQTNRLDIAHKYAVALLQYKPLEDARSNEKK